MPEPVVYARQEAPGRPIEITRGGYVMVKVTCYEEVLQLLQVCAAALEGMPKRPSPCKEGHMERDGYGNGRFVAPTFPNGGTIYKHVHEPTDSVHVVEGRQWPVWRLNDRLYCLAANCPVCSPRP